MCVYIYIYIYTHAYLYSFPGGSVVKNPPAMQEMWVLSLDLEDPMGKEMAIHSSMLVWEIPGTEKPGRLVHGVTKELDMT